MHLDSRCLQFKLLFLELAPCPLFCLILERALGPLMSLAWAPLAWALPQEEAVGLPAVEGDGDVGGVRPGSGRQQKHPVLSDVDAKGQVVSIPLSAALSMIHSGYGASADRIQRIIAANRHQHDQVSPSQPILCGTTLAAVFTRRGVTRIWYGWVERFGYSTAGKQFSIKDSTFPFDFADRKADQKVLMSWYDVAPEHTWPPGASSGNPPLVVGPVDRDLGEWSALISNCAAIVSFHVYFLCRCA